MASEAGAVGSEHPEDTVCSQDLMTASALHPAEVSAQDDIAPSSHEVDDTKEPDGKSQAELKPETDESHILEEEQQNIAKLFESSFSIVDDRVVEKMTYGVLAHFLPDLQKAKGTLAELTENQRILIETVQQENSKFSDCQALTDVTETMEKAKLYHSKLLSIKKEMHQLHEKSAKLKKRAVRLQQQKQKEALQQEQRRERELERERQLIAKPAMATPPRQ